MKLNLHQVFSIGPRWSSRVILTNGGIQDWVGGPQWWAERPPLIFEKVQNLCLVKKSKVAQEGIMSWLIVFIDCNVPVRKHIFMKTKKNKKGQQGCNKQLGKLNWTFFEWSEGLVNISTLKVCPTLEMEDCIHLWSRTGCQGEELLWKKDGWSRPSHQWWREFALMEWNKLRIKHSSDSV